MNSSPKASRRLLPEDSALQHERAPRPLPLFLDLVRQAAEGDPELGREALVGLRAYESAERRARPGLKTEVARIAGACLRDHGGAGPPAILIPSLINPPTILDLDPQVSLTAAIARMGRRALLLDWGSGDSRKHLSIAGHIEELLLPLLRSIGEPAALIGYCLGGTMAIAAANIAPAERVATLAAPWHFSRYPEKSLAALQDMWRASEPAARALGALPMEVLQASFWSLDAARTVQKFAEFGRLDPGCPDTQRFIALEDWANEGEPLPYPAARELLEAMFGEDLPGKGEWWVGGVRAKEVLEVPSVNLTAERDLIAPASTAPIGKTVGIKSGHVGMIVGSARAALHRELRTFLDPACRPTS